MRRVAAVGASVLAAIACSACSADRWPPPTTPAAHKSVAPRLRIGVKPLVNDAPNVTSSAATVAAVAGVVFAPHMTYTMEWTKPPLNTFVHDMGRVSSMPLFDALRADPRFALVAFEPFEEASYDLVVTGNVRRIGFAAWVPFVPLPAFLGSAISFAASTMVWATEIDLVVRAPLGGPVIRYGLQATCVDSEPDCRGSYSQKFSTVVREGFASFVAQLDRYLDARDEAFWAAARGAARARYYHSLDPDLARLEDEARAASEPRRAELESAIETRIAMLDALWEIEQADEDGWAATSASRVEKEIATTNANAEAAQTELIKAMLTDAALSGLSAAQYGASPAQRRRIHVDMEKRVERDRKKLDRKNTEMTKRLVDDAMGVMEKAGADRRARRAAWMDRYRAAAGSASSVNP